MIDYFLMYGLVKVALNQLVEAVQLHCSCLQTHVFVYME